jgi:signal transduction histidine kinase
LLQETLRMQVLIDRLLLLARADADELGLHRATVDLDDIVNEVLVALPAPRVSLDSNDVHPAQVNGDRDLLEQVVRNLVENAVRQASGRVEIRLHATGGQAVITVDDDGPGIPVERRDEAFRRFARLDAARDRGGGGVGLGLAIVAGIVAAHAGTIEVDRTR